MTTLIEQKDSNTSLTSSNFFENMDKIYKFAEFMSKSDLIPAHYQGKPANVFIAAQTAYRMNLDPMFIMQSTFVVKGKLGMNSSFAISRANSSGIFKSGIKYKSVGEGANLSVTAYAALKSDNSFISYTISMATAQAEGWTSNPKYKSLPELMLMYRAATFLIRTHVPEILNGMHTIEEVQDVNYSKDKVVEIDIDGEEAAAIIEDGLTADATLFQERPKQTDLLASKLEKIN
jgi:hypothetical protein